MKVMKTLLNCYENALQDEIYFNIDANEEEQVEEDKGKDETGILSSVDCTETILLRTTFFCNFSGLQVETGLSMCRQFKPVIKIIINNLEELKFEVNEWEQIINNLHWLSNGYFQNSAVSNLSFICCGNIFISENDMNDGNKVIALTMHGKTIYLTKNNVQDLCIINNFYVKSQIDNLVTLNFKQFYNSFLEETNGIISEYKLKHKGADVDLEELIDNFCNIDVQVEKYCLKECMLYNKNTVLEDINKNSNYK